MSDKKQNVQSLESAGWSDKQGENRTPPAAIAQAKSASSADSRTAQQASPDLPTSEGYGQALSVMHKCATEHGFLATPTEKDNYRRIWGRDSAIIGLAALLSQQEELISVARQSLRTLVRYQGPHGEIPSNVDPQTERVSYGGTAGRVDSNLWFVILVGQYWKRTEDDKLLDTMLEPLEQVRNLLGAWEFNTRGLLYVPPTGDWADEYLQSGYVLYDQLLYFECLRTFCDVHKYRHGSEDHQLRERVARLKHLIRANYWFCDSDDVPDDAYHEILFEKGKRAAPNQSGSYWMPFFSPAGYGYRFDALANALTGLLGIADCEQADSVDDFIEQEIVPEKIRLLPAFSPVITPCDEQWEDLQMTFSHSFKNQPYEYHNGGLWPLVTGFYAASLAHRGKTSLAREYAQGIHQANGMPLQDTEWSFPEFLHGKKLTPGGTHPMGWSAAAAVIAEQAAAGNTVFV